MYKVLKFINGKTTNIFENIDFKDVEHIEKMCKYWFDMVRNSKAAQFLIIENDRIIDIINHEEELKIPSNLDECVDYLDGTWSNDDKLQFAMMKESDAISYLHHGTGRNLRNNWGLWDVKSVLNKYFNSIGIFHADDMSSIILTSYHRKLNDIEINLEEQINSYKEYWENETKS